MNEDNVIPLPGLLGPGEGEQRQGPSPPESGEAIPAPDSSQLCAAAEAVLFTVGDPLPFSRLRACLGLPEEGALRAALVQLQVRYERAGHGLRLAEVAGGWQIRTHRRCARWVMEARGQRPLKLSRAALETLAIVAYQQPVTRQGVEDLRGVDPGSILRMLVDRQLIKSLGHREEPGRPLLYGTTARFLEVFGLRDLSDLPTLQDLRELQDDGPVVDEQDDLPEVADEQPPSLRLARREDDEPE